jgi:hypothetical protein
LPGVRPPVPTTILPSQDPSGQVPDLALSVLLVAGYLAATFAMQRTKTAAAHRRVGCTADNCTRPACRAGTFAMLTRMRALPAWPAITAAGPVTLDPNA